MDNMYQLPSGSYRVRKKVNGQRYSMVFDHKPSEKEILLALTEQMVRKDTKDNAFMTFRHAAAKYIDMKRNVLSVNTVREYTRTCDRLSEWFINMPIADITQIHINKQINELSVDRSPKTVRNYHGFISAVLGTFRPELNIKTTLPQKIKNIPYTPTQEDVKRILEHVKDTEYYIPFVLACYGLRRGEILAINPETDIECDVLHISKALAMDLDNKWVIKSTKTTSSTRDIIIPKVIADRIKKQGYVFNGYPNQLTDHLGIIQKRLGIPHFSIHKLRHYFASVMSANGVPDADIMALGGWETDYVMKHVYRHSMLEKEEKRKRDALSKMHPFIF